MNHYSFKKNAVEQFKKIAPADETGIPDIFSKEDVCLLHRILSARTQAELKDVSLEELMKIYYLFNQKEVTDLFLKRNFLEESQNMKDFQNLYSKNKRRRLI